MSMRRPGWCRQTWEGAWPGVSTTVQGPRSVSIVTPSTSSRSGSTRRAMPLPRSRALADHARSGSTGTPLMRATSKRRASSSSWSSSAARMCALSGCIHSSQPLASTTLAASP